MKAYCIPAVRSRCRVDVLCGETPAVDGLANRSGECAPDEKLSAAPQEVVIPRHRVSPSARPMTGSSGVSSTPRLFDSRTGVGEDCPHPPSRVLTAVGV